MNDFTIPLDHPNVPQALLLLRSVRFPLHEIAGGAMPGSREQEGEVYAFASADRRLSITFCFCDSYSEASELDAEYRKNRLAHTASTVNGGALCLITTADEELRMELISSFAGRE